MSFAEVSGEKRVIVVHVGLTAEINDSIIIRVLHGTQFDSFLNSTKVAILPLKSTLSFQVMSRTDCLIVDSLVQLLMDTKPDDWSGNPIGYRLP